MSTPFGGSIATPYRPTLRWSASGPPTTSLGRCGRRWRCGDCLHLPGDWRFPQWFALAVNKNEGRRDSSTVAFVNHTEPCSAVPLRASVGSEATPEPSVRADAERAPGGWMVTADAAELGPSGRLVTMRLGRALVIRRGAGGILRAEEPPPRCEHRSGPLVLCEIHGWIWVWQGPPGEAPVTPEYLGELMAGWGYSTHEQTEPTGYIDAVQARVGSAHARVARARLAEQWPSRAAAVRTSNVWLSRPSTTVMVVLVLVPIDRARTRIYVRIYRQAPVRTRLVGLRDAAVRLSSCRRPGHGGRWRALSPLGVAPSRMVSAYPW